MKRFISSILVFIAPYFIIYVPICLFVLPNIIEKKIGISTKKQILKSFNNSKKRDYELIIMGNSGTYRGINPDLLDMKSYNFSHDNDSYNQIYYKLKTLKHKRINHLILGIDYFQFSYLSDTRNYIYTKLLHENYKKDYESQNEIDFFFQETNILKFQRIIFLKDIFIKRQKGIYLKENGQYIFPGIASEKDKCIYKINRLPIQEKYFEKILKHCKKNKIKTYLCMLPVRKNAMINYSKRQINEFNKFISQHINKNVILLDYSNQKKWRMSDFSDITHLNETGADKFSKQLNDTLTVIINNK